MTLLMNLLMNYETRQRLNRINRAFYEDVADEFDRTREQPWAGWDRVLRVLSNVEQVQLLQKAREPVARGAALRVLDVGCGNGRFGLYLADRLCDRAANRKPDRRLALPDLMYTGVDANPSLLSLARSRLGERKALRSRLVQADIVATDARSALPKGPYDLVVLFGLLHHIPGADTRLSLLRAALDLLDPGGMLALTAWRFGEAARFDRHVLAWETHNQRASEPIAIDQLEQGDHLLSFGEQSQRPRYCHYTSDDELQAWSSALPATPIDRFRADGRSADLNEYLLLQRKR